MSQLEWVPKDAKVFRTDGKIRGLELIQKITETPLIVILTKRQPNKEIIIRREDDILYIIYIFWDRNNKMYRYHYLVISFNDFKKSADGIKKISSFIVIGRIIKFVIGGYVPAKEINTYQDKPEYIELSKLIAWRWRS